MLDPGVLAAFVKFSALITCACILIMIFEIWSWVLCVPISIMRTYGYAFIIFKLTIFFMIMESVVFADSIHPWWAVYFIRVPLACAAAIGVFQMARYHAAVLAALRVVYKAYKDNDG